MIDAQEIQKHNSAESCWIVVRGHAYDVTGMDLWHHMWSRTWTNVDDYGLQNFSRSIREAPRSYSAVRGSTQRMSTTRFTHQT